jgi:C-terminal processing protease CtpA/Prc
VSLSHHVEELRHVKAPSSEVLSQLGVDDLCPVTQVSKNSPADHADISTGDIIEEVKSLDSNVYELTVVHLDGSTTVEYLVMLIQ